MSQPKASYTPFILVTLQAGFFLPLVFVLATALGAGITAQLFMMLITVGVIGWASFGPVSAAIDTQGIPKSTTMAATVVAFLAIACIGGVSLFMADVKNDRFVWHHKGDFGVKHNCFTCYTMAAHVEDEDLGNVYDTTVLKKASQTKVHQTLDKRFNIDAYPYPPPFLVLHKVLLLFSQDFFVLRRLWFLLLITFVCATFAMVTSWAGAWTRNSSLLFLPVIFLAPSALTALQIQNVHPMIIAAALGGAVALTRNRSVLGSILLACAILAKIWPAVLLVPFALAGRWRHVTSTLLAMLGLSMIAWVLLGTDIFQDFVTYQVPRLMSGEAFGFAFKSPRAMTANTSVFGLWHKLYAVGLLEGKASTLLPKALSWGYLAVAGAIILWSCRATRRIYTLAHKDTESGLQGRIILLVQWLGCLGLAQLRSPFLPWPYGVFSTLILFVVLATQTKGWIRGLNAFGALYVGLYLPFSFVSDRVNFIYGMIGTVFVMTVSIVALVWAARQSKAMGQKVSAF